MNNYAILPYNNRTKSLNFKSELKIVKPNDKMLENDLTIIEEASKPTAPAVTKKPAKATQKEIQERIEKLKAEERTRNRDNWNKVKVVGYLIWALSFAALATVAVKTYKGLKNFKFSSILGKKDNTKPDLTDLKKLKDEFIDLSRDNRIVGIDDKSIDPTYRKWAKGIINALRRPKELAEFTASDTIPNSYYVFGPSGTGKTYNADVLLKELGAKRIKRTYSDFGSKWVSETATNITTFFNNIETLLKENPKERECKKCDLSAFMTIR